MKINKLLLFLLFLNSVVKAQKITADWTQKLKTVSGAYKDYQYDKSLAAGNGDFISAYKSFGDIDIKLLKFNATLEISKELVFKLSKENLSGKSMSYLDFVKIEGRYFIVLEEYLKKEKSKNIYFQEINSKEMLVTAEIKKIASFDLSDENGITSDVGIHSDFSTDSTKLMLWYEPELKKKENKYIQLIVLNSQLEKLSDLKYDFGQLYKQVLISNISVGNDGKIYITHNTYEKDFERNYIKSDGDKIPSYTTTLSVIDLNNKKILYKINNQGKFIHQLCLASDIGNNPVFTGLYKDIHNGRLTGVFKGDFDKTNGEVNIKTSPFEDDLLALIDKDGFGKSAGAKKGIDNEFIVRNIISVSDGVIHMIAEYDDHLYTWGDLLIVTFKTNGKTATARLPKNQQLDGMPYTSFSWEKWKSYGYSFSSTYAGDNLLIFYNDKESNLHNDFEKKAEIMEKTEKSSFVFAEFSHEGRLLKREAVFSNKDQDKYVTSMNLCRVSDTKIILHGLRSCTFTNSIKMGLLTIK